MKFKLTVLVISLLLVFTLVGCDNPITRFVNQVEIGNTFSDFAPGYADILQGKREKLSSKSKNSLASEVSMEISIDNIELPELTELQKIGVSNSGGITIKINDVTKEDFIDFLEADDVEKVRNDLQKEWNKYNNFVSQAITEVKIFHDDIDFDEAPEFNSDTVSAIRSIIDVSNNTGNLQAQIAMKINGEVYEGIITAGFVKSGEDWKINGIEINMEEK